MIYQLSDNLGGVFVSKSRYSESEEVRSREDEIEEAASGGGTSSSKKSLIKYYRDRPGECVREGSPSHGVFSVL